MAGFSPNGNPGLLSNMSYKEDADVYRSARSRLQIVCGRAARAVPRVRPLFRRHKQQEGDRDLRHVRRCNRRGTCAAGDGETDDLHGAGDRARCLGVLRKLRIGVGGRMTKAFTTLYPTRSLVLTNTVRVSCGDRSVDVNALWDTGAPAPASHVRSAET